MHFGDCTIVTIVITISLLFYIFAVILICVSDQHSGGFTVRFYTIKEIFVVLNNIHRLTVNLHIRFG